ncbi:amino acid ABC transporter permease [Streptomyces sp. ISL-99]|uniref:amino acid ABC transporter permease n=1 Tax=Streptomyces sp. ISL-99 TaxID=2819193 RepID=UPI001BE9337B|nr:amino acid ABC transporter permease [Streptomyces sp. ISL-99]MBT2526862.1 amino acid ABC transporter permease [Streptomyces sp. ISL-99]
MAWDEWEQLKAEAAQRQSANMQLNQLPSSGGGGSGGADRLKHTDKPWTDAAGIAGALRTSTATAKNELHDAHAGIESGTEGLDSVGALKGVLRSWEERLEAVRDECNYLESALRGVVKAQGASDARVKSSIDSVRSPVDEKAR